MAETHDTAKENANADDRAAAFRDETKPGPKESPVQVRHSGAGATRDGKKGDWDKTDEASDESFPASDSAAKY